MYAWSYLDLHNPIEIFKKYKYIDPSRYLFDSASLNIISKYDLDTLFKFFDLFQNINQYENGHYTMGMNFLVVARTHNNYIKVFKIIKYLINRGMKLRDICYSTMGSNIIEYIFVNYCVIDGITNLLNDNEFIIKNINSNFIKCINTIILISKTRIIPNLW